MWTLQLLKQMGCISNGASTNSNTLGSGANERTKGSLKIATLNYCGIMNSPFEFYCDDYLTELKDISKEFVELLPTYFPDFDKATFKWKMGKIDLKIRTRYSPMFSIRAGIDKQDNFMSSDQFKQSWDSNFESERSKINMDCTEEQKAVVKIYDFAMFHTLLRYVDKTVKLEEIKGTSASQYLKKLGPLYNLSFLDEDKKCEKVKSNFETINADVFFFQEYSQNFYKSVKETGNYHLRHDDSKDTLIIAKKSSFNGQPSSADIFLEKTLGQQLRKMLNWNERSSFMAIDNYIFINAHMSSKADKSKAQIEEMKSGLFKLKKELPEVEIVVAGDLNSYAHPFGKGFDCFPEDENAMTTVKKRTVTQGQFNKADKIVRESKDKIISTMKIRDGKISYITGAEPSTQNLVPTNEHPFDHFVVMATVEKK